MFEKRAVLNKKGQEGMTLTTLLLIIVGAVVAAVIILGATGILGDIFGFGDVLPSEVEAVAQSCRISAEANLIVDYCYTFKKVGDMEHISCQDSRVKSSLEQQGIKPDFECDEGTTYENAWNNYCDDIPEIDQDETSVDGRLCNVRFGA